MSRCDCPQALRNLNPTDLDLERWEDFEGDTAELIERLAQALEDDPCTAQ